MSRTTLILPSAFLLLVLSGPAAADEVVLTSGKAIKDVKVIEETDAKVVYVNRRLKKVTYPKSIVRSVVRKHSVIHDYDERLAAATDADAVMELAAWAAAQKFHKTVIRRLNERAVQLNPQHPAANQALGRVQHKGEWMTPADRDARAREDEAAQKRAEGLVEHEGQWVTPADKEKLEQGLRQYKGEWKTADQIKEAQGYVKYGGEWVRKDELAVKRLLGPARRATGLGKRLQLEISDHYAVLGDLEAKKLKNVAKTMEKLYAEWLRVFPSSKDENLLEGKHRVYVFRKNPPYRRLARWAFEQQKQSQRWDPARLRMEKVRTSLRQRVTSFWEVHFKRVNPQGDQYGRADTEIMSAHVQMPDPYEGLRAHCVHFGGNILVTRFVNAYRFPTWWLNEGIAYYFEKRITGKIHTFSADVGGGGYTSGDIEGDRKNPWLDTDNWPGQLAGLVQKRRDPQLQKMKGKDIFSDSNRLTAQELAKAWSVVTYLIHSDAKKFEAFVRDAKQGPGDTAVERETASVIKHYGGYDKVEKGWRKYVGNNFRIVR
ncbi:MAG: hypothetical protein O7C98_02455 [Planctomycetota bacterium]|nr:hypothetical protein [Planctomycetota bacterium]